MQLQDLKQDKSLWEKMHIEGVGKVLLVEESYYDGIVKLVEKSEESEMTNFQVEDIDGCEFVKVRTLGNALISYDHDFDGFMTGKIQVVYSDGSDSAISMEEAQRRIDSGEWTVIKS